jgi:hypothetical protein
MQQMFSYPSSCPIKIVEGLYLGDEVAAQVGG